MENVSILKTSLALFGAFFSLTFVFAQEKAGKIKIDWQQPIRVYNSPETYDSYLFCLECKTKKTAKTLLPNYQISEQGKIISNILLSDLKTQTLTEEELGLVDTSVLTTKFQVEYPNADKKTAQILLLRKNAKTKQFEKLLSFSYLIGLEASKNQTYKRIAQVSNSILNAGRWVKMGFTKTGMYRVTGASLRSAGLNLIGKSSANIRLFGNGGGMLSENLAVARAADLTENPIQVFDGGDGVFNENDYVVFYVQGPHRWNFNIVTRKFAHENNIYSDSSYYFITYSDEVSGKRITNSGTLAASSSNIITSFDERLFIENDLTNLLKNGRFWYGEKFDFVVSRNFKFPAPGLVPNTPIDFRVNILNTGFSSGCTFTSTLNEKKIRGQLLCFPKLNGVYVPIGTPGSTNFRISSDSIIQNSESELDFELTYNKKNSADEAYLDFIEASFKRELALIDDQTLFRATDALNSATSTFQLKYTTATDVIWDVTQPINAFLVPFNISGNLATFSDSSTSLKEYAVFKPANLPSPLSLNLISNQNLHGLEPAQLVIISHKNFVPAANKLANFRSTVSNISAKVVTTDQIYNEFSSGAQDVTAIRDFLSYLYNRGDQTRIKYALMFGDCSYDYKNRISGNTNFIPIFESPESLHPVNNNYASDDYFAVINDNVSIWESNDLDIGIGRLPLKTLEEANLIVDKIIGYDTARSSFAPWRNIVTMVADDGDGCLHSGSNGADGLAGLVESRRPAITVDKIYLATFPQNANPGGARAPEAATALKDRIESGSLLVNYTGHGSEVQWMDENIFNIDVINKLTNKNRLSFFVTATCEFGRHDDPSRVSGAESIVLNPEGGGIGIMTTGRPVYSFSNQAINASLYNSIFTTENGKPLTLGETFRRAKNGDAFSKTSNRGFILLGDPSSTLAFPARSTQLTRFNNKALDSVPATDKVFKALSTVSLEGRIRKADGTFDSTFNGSVNTIIYDKRSVLIAKDDEPRASCNSTYRAWKNIVYNGNSQVINGRYAFSFVVPKDISYDLEQVRISQYAKSNEMQNGDCSGFNLDFKIGGTNDELEPDSISPTINLFLNDLTFQNNGITDNSPIFIAKLFDKSGINTSRKGIGHEMTLLIDEDPNQFYVVNDYFSTLETSFQTGFVRYPLRDLKPGPHTLTFKGWDTHNNSATARLSFNVVDNQSIALQKLSSYPNPFNDHVTIAFENSLAGEPITVEVAIMDLVGKKVVEMQYTTESAPSRFGQNKELVWDAKNKEQGNIPQGTYICEILIRSNKTGAESRKSQRLIKIR